MKISLIIPAYNEEKYIGSCLDFAIKNSNGRFFEIIVIDNNCTDKTKEITEKFSGVKVVSEPKKGLTYARQRGFLEARGDILAYIDADTRLPLDWFDKVEKDFEKNEKLVCLSGPYHYYDIPKWQNFLVKIYWLLSLPAYWFTGYLTVGGNFAIKKKVIEKMGGFDTTIAFYGEDTNIARRASEFGQVKFILSLEMLTSGRRFFGQGFLNTAFIYVGNFLSEVFRQKPLTKEYEDIR